MNGGTAREIGTVAELVLAWIAVQRNPGTPVPHDRISKDDLRRIELVALAAREAAMFHELYGMEESHGTGAD